MDPWAIIVANTAGLAVIVGGITLCVRFDQQGKTRRRELEHAERMRAVETGHPPDDSAVARYQALGAVGVTVPIVSLSAAAVGSCFAFLFAEPLWRFVTLAVVWVVCGIVCVTALPIVLARLRGPGPDRFTPMSDSRHRP